MSNGAGLAIGVALFVGYLGHFLLYILSMFKIKNIDEGDMKIRASKMHLFGAAALLSMKYQCTYSAVFAWLTLLALVFYHVPVLVSSDESRKKLHNLSYFVYNTLICAWWIGEAIFITTGI